MASPKFSAVVLFALLSVLALASNIEAFVPSKSVTSRTPFSSTAPVAEESSTQLFERQWNFNEGQSPWGMKINAETWNGRVAQVRLLCSLSFEGFAWNRKEGIDELLSRISVLGLVLL